MAKPVRRVITGKGSDGRSAFISDQAATTTLGTDHTPVTLIELWKTDEAPAESASLGPHGHDGDGWRDPVDGPINISPGPAGSLFRICEFPPLSQLEGADWGAAFAAMGQEHGDGADVSSGYHSTSTIDYIVVLEGEIYAMLEGGETLLQPGDTLIQRGTMHAWENRGSEPCRFVSVLVGAAQP
jgi:hypothetical protein